MQTCRSCHWWMQPPRLPHELIALFEGRTSLGACARSVEGATSGNAPPVQAIAVAAVDPAVLATSEGFSCAGWELRRP